MQEQKLLRMFRSHDVLSTRRMHFSTLICSSRVAEPGTSGIQSRHDTHLGGGTTRLELELLYCSPRQHHQDSASRLQSKHFAGMNDRQYVEKTRHNHNHGPRLLQKLVGSVKHERCVAEGKLALQSQRTSLHYPLQSKKQKDMR